MTAFIVLASLGFLGLLTFIGATGAAFILGVQGITQLFGA